MLGERAGIVNDTAAYFRRLIAGALGVTILSATGYPALAGCDSKSSDGDTTVTCTGNVYPKIESLGGGSGTYTYIFESLNANATNGSSDVAIGVSSVGKEGENHGDNGQAAFPLTLEFSGAPYEIDSSALGLEASSSGGRGHDGKSHGGDTAAGNKSGGNAGDGGTGGSTAVSFNSGDIQSVNGAITVRANGGAGGNGGEGKTSSGTGTGGAGGIGGTAGEVSITLGSDQAITVDGGSVLAVSTGGVGGQGGKGASFLGEGDGGKGGDGGDGGGASIVTSNVITIQPTGTVEAEDGIAAGSHGGDGGKGGNASGTVGSSAANKGGGGGDGGAVTVDLSNGPVAIKLSGNEIDAIVAISTGGDGGKGGEGETDVGTEAQGGDGGAGGAGGNVTVTAVTTSAGIALTGEQSQGIFARSYGGNSGDGGNGAGKLANGKSGSTNTAGPGGAVDVTLTGSIDTTGSESNAILAQSIGGFAGSAGTSEGFVAYGANGRSGGPGGAVTVTISEASVISTKDDYSDAVLAQSVGGGGGRGSASDGIVALGGTGSSGGDAGAVSVTLQNAIISTKGDQSAGVEAQSTGGTGGSAGSSSGVTSLGGKGGGGGNGGAVTITSNSQIETTGDQSDAIFAQSVGGGGGNAHSTSGLVALGGSGGNGGSGGTVSVVIGSGGTNTQLSTLGSDADAVFLQSVGGGGGSGSNAISAGAELAVAFGGTGGNGGAGGNVSFSDSGASAYAITTSGAHATGIFAQSLGGGGGAGGYAIAASAGYAADFSLGVSGSGGNGGNSGSVTIDSLATISTAEDHSSGIVAQSTGGGGGHSGIAIASSNSNGVTLGMALGATGGGGGDAAAVQVTTSGSITTKGALANAIFAESVGGGGGYSGATITGDAVSSSNISLSLGASGGAGGDGGEVTVTAKGATSTTGSSSGAIVAQSTGGTGGSAHAVIAASGASDGLNADLSVGGSGGAGGDGAAVSVTVSAPATTLGDNATAISAQSIGGGGGNGSLTVSGSATSSTSTNLAVGGSGGAGGSAADVTVTVSDSVSTSGNSSIGILAQSIGNSGGHGGLSIAGTGQSGGDVNLSIGGSGKSGGSSGDVSVTVTGSKVSTQGAFATGIKATSHGGGGGSAVGSINGTVASMGEVGVTIGGSGATGGAAGSVTVTNSAVISTTNQGADLIFASSHGGSGGHGGFAIEGALTGGEYSGSANVNVGGSGGGGGTAGAVTVTNNNAASGSTAEGYQSNGIVAQSIGGSGGYGGSVYSGNLTLSSSLGVDVGVNVGGSGGSGSTASSVTVTNDASITTLGIYGNAIFAQSVGGEGGYGGATYNVVAQMSGNNSSEINVSVGGSGGSGGNSGSVAVTNNGALTTMADSAPAIYAQSTGGGGGRGGSAASVLFDLTETQPDSGTTASVNANIDVGGTGGAGGDSKSVTVTNNGTISTTGASSWGIYAQSVGGGGGDGGSVSGYVLNVTANGCTFNKAGWGCTDSSDNKTTYSPTLQLEIGGNGGGGGDGAPVTVTNTAPITTEGTGVYAIFAQSVGGGGGHGGYGNLGTDIWAPDDTENDFSDFVADIVSEGFSNLRSFQNVEIAIGGTGGLGGDGDDVMVSSSDLLTTKGASAYAIFAQSIGGGGGHGGAALGGFGSVTQSLVGGRGSAGGDGGDVSVSLSGGISSSGDGGVGIYAQSVGGGGGSAGDIEQSITDSWADLNIGVGVNVQENPGNGGNGGSVKVELAAGSQGITTTGDNAHGIYAQSVGGTGGAAHLSGVFGGSPVVFAGSVGDAGKGGDVTITVDAPITVSGESATAVYAQSVSGTESSTDKPSTSGDVSVSISKDVTASGASGRGLLLQSQGIDGTGTIAVTVSAGATVSSTAESYETIGFMHGDANTLTNDGAITRPDGGSVQGYVLRAEGAALAVTNTGSLSGSILLDSSSDNSLANSGTLELGTTVNLGTSGTLTNDGTLSAGTLGTIASSDFTGILTQNSDGVLQVDFDVAGSNDLITIVSGKSATFNGTVVPNVIGTAPSNGQTDTLVIVSSDVGLTAPNLAVSDTSTVDYSVSTQTNSGVTDLLLSYLVDYSPSDAGLSANSLAFGDYIGDLVDAQQAGAALGGAGSEFVDDLAFFVLGIEDDATLGAVYQSLAPGAAFIPGTSTTLSSLRFSDNLNSCPQVDDRGLATFARNGSCGWIQFSGVGNHSGGSGDSVAFNETVFSVTAGVQKEVAEGWFLGLAGNYEHASLSMDKGSGNGNRYQAGVIAKKEIGQMTLSGSLSGGYGSYDLTRTVVTPTGAMNANGKPSTWWIAGHARVAQRFDLTEDFYALPLFDAGIQQFWQGDFSESGAGDYGARVQGFQSTIGLLNPKLEVGAGFELLGMAGELKAQGGLLGLVGNTDPSTHVQLTGVPEDGPSFTIVNDNETLFADLGASLRLQVRDQVFVGANFQTLLGNSLQSYYGGARLQIAF